MGHQEAGADVFPTDFTIPDDGDDINGSAFGIPFEALADRTKYLKNRIDPLTASLTPIASIAALKAITTPTDGLVRTVKHYGLYSFDAAVATAEHQPWIVAADDATTGRWVRLGNIHQPGTSFKRVPLVPAMTTKTNNVTRAKTAAFYQDHHLFDTVNYTYGARWESGELIFNVAPNGALGGSGTNGLIFDITPFCPPRATLTRARVFVTPSTPGGGRSNHPTTHMSAGLFRQTPGLAGLDSLKSASDFTNSFANTLGDYENAHNIEIISDQNNVIDADGNAFYWLQVWDEQDTVGSNVRSGNKVTGILLDFVNAVYAPIPGFV